MTISEFMAANQQTLADDFGEYSDWIELHNSGATAVNLQGWSLTDDAQELQKWQFPDVAIQPGAFLVVHASDRDRTSPAAPLHTNFRLSAEGEYLALVRSDGQTIESSYSPQFPAQVDDVSYGHSDDAQRQGYFLTATPGGPNGASPLADAANLVVVSELMYSLPRATILDAEDTALEFIELHNRGPSAVNVTGWRFTQGIEFTLPTASIPAGGYLVVAADVQAFRAAHPTVTNVVGGWTGTLSNRGETVELVNAAGVPVDQLRYADEGDWAMRTPGPLDRGSTGWIWTTEHDGQEKSAELINPSLPNDNGQNWAASISVGGTPGRANSRAASNIAPLVQDVMHDPPLPRSSESVRVTAQLTDELLSGMTARVYWRDASQGTFQSVLMADNGQHGDGEIGDGVYGATLPARPNLTVVEYYVEVRDTGGLARTWPAPTSDGQQQTNALYQVFDAFDATAPWEPGSPPIYHVIMTPAERQEFTNIDRFSNAQFNATFIAMSGTGIDVRYNTGVRMRGSGSRTDPVANNRINLPSDRPWQGIYAINVNQRNPINQIAGSALYRLAGIPAADVHAVRLLSNGIDLKNGGYYVHSEVLDSEYAENHFPTDSEGNLYRGRRDDESPPGGQGAGLQYRGEDPLPYVSYEKESNAAEADWSDVIELTYRLNVTPDEQYVEAVREVVDVSQWFRTIAIDSLMDNGEFGLLTGDREGDDYAMYRGINDARFRMIPYDWDTLFGNPTEGLFPANNVAPLNKLVTHPEFLPDYYAQYLSVIEQVLENEQTGAILDNALRLVASNAQIENIKQFLAARAEFVRGQIQQQLTVTSDLDTVGGVPRSTSATYQLSGQRPQPDTRAIRVGDDLAQLNAGTQGSWTFSSGNTIDETLLDMGSQWRYLADGTDAGTAWRAPGFNDSAWPRGPGQLGYGDDDEATTFGFGGDPNNRYVTSYFRSEFQVDDPDRFDRLSVRLVYDDGAAVYLNGTEVLRVDLPASANYNTLATELRGRDIENQIYTFPLPTSALDLLVPGRNVLAVEMHQGSRDSPDVSFDMALDAGEAAAGELDLRPGMNRIPIRSYDNTAGTGTPLAETSIDLWYDNGSETLVTDAIGAPTRWTAANGPYRVRGNVVVSPAAVLTIEPGTTVFFENNARLTVNGGLVAVGTAEAPIWFTRLPGQSTWRGIQIASSSYDNRLEHAILQYGITDDGMLGVVNSQVTVDHVVFDHTDRRRIRSIDSSLVVRNSTFTDIFQPGQEPTTNNLSEHIWGGGIPAGGQWLVQGNSFGHITGHNDGIDFDGPQAAGVFARIIDNEFHGGGDDALDMTGNVWVEGNVFRNYIKDPFNTDPGQSNTISSSTGEYWVVRNVFENVQHASLVKETAFMHFLNNTVINSEFAPLYFDLPGQTSGPGRGARVEGSVFAQVTTTFDQVEPTTELQVNFSFLPAADEGLYPGLLNRFGDPHVAGEDGNYALRTGSKAHATGPGGIDMGATIAPGAQLVNLPGPLTNQTSATIFVAGPGLVEYRYQLDNQPVTAPQTTQQPIHLTNLAAGNHQLRVWGRDVTGNWQSEPTLSETWRVDATLSQTVRINEVLADNRSAVAHGGRYLDLVELYNYGGAVVDLSGYSITDRADQPRRFVFPAGSTVRPHDYLLLHSGNESLPSTLAMGFGLDRQGDGLYLFDPAGTLVDAVEFGVQLPDLSLGRWGRSGTWTLTEPTFGQANQPTPLGDPADVRINEWYASGKIRLPQDMLELFNPGPLPVALGGYSLTDEPFDIPARSVIPAATFIGAEGYLPLVADGDPQDGRDHLDFNLSATHEHLALFSPQVEMIDQVFYYGQTSEVSQGRVPDGQPHYEFRRVPTLGGDNGSAVADRVTILEVDFDEVWRYNAAGQDLGTTWRQPAYDDSGWLSGPGLLGNENEPLPVPLRTEFPLGAIAYYFRKTIALDTSVPDLRVELSTIIDDGVIVYVNGQEVLRNGMPGGAVNYQTLANRDVNEGQLEGPFVIPNNVWVTGNNVIAVEVHQTSSVSSDLVFGLNLVATAAEPDTQTGHAEQLIDQLRITELMYHPAGENGAEYVELQNVGDQPLNLSGVRLGGGVEFEFPAGTLLAPLQYIVVTDNVAEFRRVYGQEANLVGPYSGRLSDDGEEIALQLASPIDTAILRFVYSPLWHPSTDGRGASLSIVDPLLDYRVWEGATSWRPTTPSPGRATPDGLPGDVTGDGTVDGADVDRLCLGVRRGEAGLDINGDGRTDLSDLEHLIVNLMATTFGDANLDGVFNSSDLVQIFAAGRYEVPLADDTRWAEGDWDCDGRFSTTDLVVAFQYGGYVAAARPGGASVELASAGLLGEGDGGQGNVRRADHGGMQNAAHADLLGKQASSRKRTPPRPWSSVRLDSPMTERLWTDGLWLAALEDGSVDERLLDDLAEEFLRKKS